MKKFYTHIIHRLLLNSTLFFGLTSTVYAADYAKYTVLSPLPGTTEAGGNTATLATYLPGIFNLLIGVGAVAAFVVITIYGLELMLTDSLATKMNAKTMLENALWGLGLIIFAYVILYTINPNLLNGNLNIETPTVRTPDPVVGSGTGGTTGTTAGNIAGVPMTQAQITESNAVRTSLETEGVYTYAGPCDQGQTRGCVNLNGLQEVTKSGLVSIKKQCGLSCSMTITGGTEAGHSTTGSHPKGLGIDLRPDSQLNIYLGIPTPTEGSKKTLTINGRSVTFTYETLGGNPNETSSGNHWHLDFI